MLWPVLCALFTLFLVIFLLKSVQSGQKVILIEVLYKHSYERTFYWRISEITDEMFLFRNFGPQWKEVKFARVPVQSFPVNFNLLTFPTFFIMFVHFMYELTLFLQLCMTILTTFGAVYFLFLEWQPPLGQDLLIHQVSRSHTTTHHNRYDSSRWVISSSQRPLPDNTHTTLTKDFNAPGGIRTHILSRREAADLRLRPRGYSNRLVTVYNYI